MPFTNPIVAGNTLVTESIQSPNYVAGSTGWSINRDGTADFANATVRGELQSPNYVAGSAGWSINRDGTAEFVDATIRGRLAVGDAGNGVTEPGGIRILPRDEVPAEIVAIYSPFGIAISAAVIYRASNSVYWWDAVCIHPVTSDHFIASGFYTSDNGSAFEYGRRRYQLGPGAITSLSANAIHEINGIEVIKNGGTLTIEGGGTTHVSNGAQVDLLGSVNVKPSGRLEVEPAGEFVIDGVSQGRGLVSRQSFAPSPSGTIATVTTTETTVTTLPNTTYAANRAYEVRLRCQSTSTTPSPLHIRLRNGIAIPVTVNPQLVYRFRVNRTVGGSEEGLEWSGVFVTGNTAVTTVLSLTCRTDSGTTTFNAYIDSPFAIEIKDVGAATDYPNTATLT